MTDHDLVDLAVMRATVVTMDAAGTVVPEVTVAIANGQITSIGPPVDAARTIDARGAIVLPGFVNAHTHLAMTLFRGLADDVDLDRFLARLLPAEDAVLSADAVSAGVALAAAESLLGGITTAFDMYFFPEAARAVAAEAGLDLHAGPVFVEGDGPDRRPFADRLAWAADDLTAVPPGHRWVAPHSTYLLAEDQLRAVAALAADHGARIHVHACETAAELAAVRARHGRTPIEVLRDTGLLGPGTVIAHAVHLGDADIDLVAAAGATVAHCPASNQKLASGFARLPELRAAGVPVALGTDGAASANDLDLWLAMRLAAYPLAARAGPGAVTARDVLAMATNGAVLAPGARADLVVLDPSSPALTPSYDAHSTAAYAASRADVRWVVAGGRLVVDDRRVTTIDVDAAIGAVRDLAPRARAATAG